ncbi:MAG: class I adenylate-forming enzyme family protein, partial [Candidatus Omnitrophica bacterium]|nr:class I adenylate-forming enzyme family protein [Candidatus Omnitrophota bacterium]
MRAKNLGDLLSASSKKYPKRIAIVFGQKKITYKTLQETTDHIAAGLIHLGIKKQDRIAILMDNSPEFVTSYYSILKAGAIAVPINYMFKIEEINYVLQDSQACSLITSRLHLETAQELRLRVESL